MQQSRADQARESTSSAQDNADRTNLHSDVIPLTSSASNTGLLGSTLNMIASMQGTISTLQTTINSLVSNKQVQSPAVPVNYQIVIIGPWISRAFIVLQLKRKQLVYYILTILTNSSELSDDKYIFTVG